MTLARLLTETVGPSDLRDGLNVTGSTIAAKLFVTGNYDAIALPAANTDAILGVTRNAIADKQHGSLAIRGLVPVTCSGTVTKGERVMPDTAGKAVTWTTGHDICGIAQSTATNDDVLVELLGPGATNV